MVLEFFKAEVLTNAPSPLIHAAAPVRSTRGRH